MSELPDRDLILAVATDLAVDPSFVEKDWHATQLIATVAPIAPGDLQPVFSGGTSLSKGYGLIRRFSEDVDFKLLAPTRGIARKVRSSYRDASVRAIRSREAWTLDEQDILVRNESRFFRCDIAYAPEFVPSEPVRTRIRLEMTLKAPALPPERRPLRSLVGEAQERPPEVAGIACVAPAETAADKLSALTWRILAGNFKAKADDSNLVRHLHDLAALEPLATGHPEFPALLAKQIAIDARRGNASPEILAMSPAESVAATVRMLVIDQEFGEQYRQFVGAMCFGSVDETPTFESAIDAVQRLGRLLQ